jgi:hypothetical protein
MPLEPSEGMRLDKFASIKIRYLRIDYRASRYPIGLYYDPLTWVWLRGTLEYEKWYIYKLVVWFCGLVGLPQLPTSPQG